MFVINTEDRGSDSLVFVINTEDRGVILERL
jgi:hypothetical protein